MPEDNARVIAILKRIHLFRGLDDAKLQIIADRLEQMEAPAGKVIYQQGDAGDYFYFILSGRVRLSRYDSRSRQFLQLGFLEDDDYFGQEVLESGWPRQLTAEASTDITLLALSVQNFIDVLQQLPVLGSRLQMILDSFRLMLRTSFSWQDPDEIIYFINRRDNWVLARMIAGPIIFGLLFIPMFLYVYLNAPGSMALLLLLLLVIAVAIGWFIWSYVDWSNDYYIVTNRRTIFLEKVVLLYDSRQESPNEAIQSTSTSTSQLGRILGYGNLAIRTFTGTIFFRSIEAPEQVMALVQEQQARAQSQQRRAELKAMEGAIQRQIGLIPPAAPPPKPPPPPKLTPFQVFLSNLFHLRYEIGGTITYRTHWWILIQKIWLPSLFLIALLAISLLRLSNQFAAISILATCSLSFVLSIIVGIWWFYQYMDWHNDVYLITPDQIVDVYKKPLGREQRQAAPIKNILSIEYKRLGIIGLVLNFGTVYIRVGDQQLTFDDVYNPSEVQRELFHRLAAKQHAERQSAAESERQRMAEWIAAYHRVTQGSQTPRTPPPSRGGF